jgi:NAD(P)H-hydrate epimerase
VSFVATETAPPRPTRLTRAQVRDIDRRSIEDYHIPGVVLMENAARSVTDAALAVLRGLHTPRVFIVCGGGNNGGDGLAVARHLHNRRIRVDLALAVDPDSYRGEARANWEIVRAMALPWRSIDPKSAEPVDFAGAALIIDALFGTGLSSPPRDVRPIDQINDSGVPVLAVDIPSGLDCDTGEPLGAACVRAIRTVTFVAEKAGFANPSAGPYLGEVLVGDIGCPRELIEEVAQLENEPTGPDRHDRSA